MCVCCKCQCFLFFHSEQHMAGRVAFHSRRHAVYPDDFNICVRRHEDWFIFQCKWRKCVMMDTQKSASVIPQCEPPVIKWETLSHLTALPWYYCCTLTQSMEERGWTLERRVGWQGHPPSGQLTMPKLIISCTYCGGEGGGGVTQSQRWGWGCSSVVKEEEG